MQLGCWRKITHGALWTKFYELNQKAFHEFAFLRLDSFPRKKRLLKVKRQGGARVTYIKGVGS